MKGSTLLYAIFAFVSAEALSDCEDVQKFVIIEGEVNNLIDAHKEFIQLYKKSLEESFSNATEKYEITIKNMSTVDDLREYVNLTKEDELEARCLETFSSGINLHHTRLQTLNSECALYYIKETNLESFLQKATDLANALRHLDQFCSLKYSFYKIQSLEELKTRFKQISLERKPAQNDLTSRKDSAVDEYEKCFRAHLLNFESAKEKFVATATKCINDAKDL